MAKIETRGRKPLREGEQTVKFTVRLAASDFVWLFLRAELGGETISATLRDLIAEERRKGQ